MLFIFIGLVLTCALCFGAGFFCQTGHVVLALVLAVLSLFPLATASCFSFESLFGAT